MQLNKISRIKNLVKQNRYLSILNKHDKYLLLESDNLNAKDTLSIRNNIENLGFKFKMTLKRLIHKAFLKIEKIMKKQFLKTIFI